MTINDLKNTKIYLSNEEDKIKFQKKVFNLGIKWLKNDEKTIDTKHPFYYINKNLLLSCSGEFTKLFFIKEKSTQIFLEDVLAIKEPKREFKPFDKVLVRNDDNQSWMPMFFSKISDSPFYPYTTTSGKSYSQCISYDEYDNKNCL